ncbi:pilus assembly protein PilY [Acinetobacter sp. 187]|uniref:PilC/PilY family type IV pilus protein n=1 Tax=Acinetobacter lanii TaxID=2715163 RepID=UPI0014079F81|nr:PilC/PilY family type IV pilus protein [Acinetobacter lanii]NHC02904.1 pilus assembly protein PilY [Acinetobacter lanii]
MKQNALSQLIKVMILGSTWLSVSTSIDASDLQIYAGPGTGGQKTLIMMLDRSGSMGMLGDDSANNSIVEDYTEFRTIDANGKSIANYSLCSATGNDGRTKYKNDEIHTDAIFPDISYTKTYCTTPTTNIRRYDRLTRLKDGMFAMLNSADPKLHKVYIGLGYYSNGDSISGVIKVPARPLGGVDSEHRKLLKQEIAKITAGSSTPTSHAYAEAAAYLLGTNTNVIHSTVSRYNYVQIATNLNDSSNQYYSSCDLATSSGCNGSWTGFIKGNYDITYYSRVSGYSDSTWEYVTYRQLRSDTVDLTDSGFSKSESSTKTSSGYISPLPENNATCNGQGIYILSDGQPNNTSDARSQLIAGQALNDSNFSCDVTDNLSNNTAGNDNGTGWKCMGAFAKRLYSGANPKNRSIQTAFVGFGKEFSGNIGSSLSKDTLNACQLASIDAGDDCSYYENDKVTPKPATIFRNSIDGFGKGGFFQVNTEADVTNSVLRAIENIEIGEIEPLSTGSWSVPVDDLNPNGVQPFGYVRVIKPHPGTNDLLWAGNLKKYHVVDGALSTAISNGTNIFNIKGEFNPLTKDIWSDTNNDGGDVFKGGAYAKVPMPTRSSPNIARKLYTNFGVDSNNKLTNNLSQDSALLKIPTTNASTPLNTAYLVGQFASDTTISKFSNSLKRKLLNYLGYNIDVNDSALPSAETIALQADDDPWNSYGGISHSLPIQITYSGSLNSDGELLSSRNQSVLFGTMEGGLRLVNAQSGEEQFVFLPSDILNDSWQSLALRKTSFHENGASHGTDAPWVSDTTYDFEETNELDEDNNPITKVKATQVNIYGGLRMGGNSYYGLDITNPNAPKFKFRVDPSQSSFSSMGQSWSKPVLANIRIDGKMKRVIVVGGGYDTCYEDPQFKLNTNYTADANKTASFKTACSSKTKAKGNSVYLIDADTGERLFWVSNSGADVNHADMVHSIVSDISTIDTDADGLIDHLYFGDLGGQIFRVDLNNLNKSEQSFGVRVVRIANLATDALGKTITNGDNPRFYEAPTLTMHREENKRFLLVGIASGDRSSPLDVAPISTNRPSNLSAALVGRPVNNVYGIIDTDAMKSDLNTNYNASLSLLNITLKGLLKDPQHIAHSDGIATLKLNYYPYSSTTAIASYGWYRSLSSNADGLERADGTFRKPGGIKAFEAPIAIKNTLVVSTYDPESQSLGEQDPCQVRVIGESFRQYYCLPFGVCLNSEGAIDYDAEKNTGWRPARDADKKGNEIVSAALGKGILGNAMVGKESTQGNCGALQLGGNTAGTGEWACVSQTKPMNWYAK